MTRPDSFGVDTETWLIPAWVLWIPIPAFGAFQPEFSTFHAVNSPVHGFNFARLNDIGLYL
jgi:hypothetical protein